MPALLVLTNVLGWSALLSSVAMPPMAVALMVASGAAPRLATQIGVRWTLAIRVALTGVGLDLMALSVSVDGGYLSILGGLLALGFGSGLAMTPSPEAITSSLPREKQGVASALNDVTREFGTALGVMLLGALLSAGYRSSIDGKLQGHPAGHRGHRARRHRQRPGGRTQRRPARAGPGPRRPAVLRRRMAAGHVGGHCRHGRPVRLHRPARTEEPGPHGR